MLKTSSVLDIDLDLEILILYLNFNLNANKIAKILILRIAVGNNLNWQSSDIKLILNRLQSNKNL